MPSISTRNVYDDITQFLYVDLLSLYSTNVPDIFMHDAHFSIHGTDSEVGW